MPIEVVRSEEQLRTEVRRRATERIVVRTRIVTEEVMVPVRIRRQVLDVVRIPIHDDERDDDGAPPSEAGPDVIEVVLHEERPVVEVVGVTVVPVERVRVVRNRLRSDSPVAAVLGREEVSLTSEEPGGPGGAPSGAATA